MLRIAEHYEASDRGRQRTGNEDDYFARAPLFAVADGMGGAQAGEVASREAAAAFEPGLPDGDPGEGLEHVIREANRRIHEMSQERTERAGMGTTVTAAYVTEDDCVVVAHVGDSRAYLWRGGELTRLTRDHSLVEELVRRGKLTEEQAETHPQRSVITRALGPEPDVEVDVESFAARAGDLYLLCSDGLTSMVSEDTVRGILELDAPLEQLGRRLVDAANDAGGRDNITVVLFRLEEAGGGDGAMAEQDTQVGAGALRADDVAGALRESEAGGDGAEGAAQAAGDEVPRRDAALSGASPPRPPAAARAPAAPERRRRRPRIPAWTLVVAVALVLVASGAWIASRAVYFLGTDPGDGRTVVLFRGVPYELPGGIELYERVGASGLTLDAIPESRRSLFTDQKLRSRDDAEELLVEAEKGRLVE
jgi:PPM family protein phosphatase